MTNRHKTIIAFTGIGITLLYFVVVTGYFIVQTPIMFRLWEVLIILSAPVILLVLIALLDSADTTKAGYKMAAIAFMACATAVTAAAHYPNVISRSEVAAGMIPNDILAWGLFLGLAFLFTSAALPTPSSHAQPSRQVARLKLVTAICGSLCLLGLLGPILNIELLWFIAVLGYGLGVPVICVMLLRLWRA